MTQTRYSFEVVFVDDYSIDNTREILEEICRDSEHCRYIFHTNNKGRGTAFKTGFENCSGKVCGFIDIDLEISAIYIPAMVNLIENHNYDLVTAYRHYLHSQTGVFHRIVLSRGYRFICRILLDINFNDTEAGCKFFKRETAASVVLASANNGWFWDTEVMVRAGLAGLKIYEMPVLFLRRKDKASTVRILPDTLDYIRNIFQFRSKIGLSRLNRSMLYWNASGYDLVIDRLYGDDIHREIAELIPEGATVVDVCGGTASLFRKFLIKKNCRYQLLDANVFFVKAVRKLGIEARYFELNTDKLPTADYLVMCSSFYHFFLNQDEIFEKLYSSAKIALIISEPVQNLSSHNFKLFAWIANWLTNPGVGDYKSRFNLESFKTFAERHNASSFSMPNKSGNAIAVFTKDEE